MSIIEVIGFLLTIAGVIFASHQNPITWLISIISPVVYVFVFFKSKLYADVLLQFFFITLSIYGFYCWKKNKLKLITAVRKIKKSELVFSFLVTVFLCAGLYLILKYYTNSDVPLADSFLTTLSIIATWLTAKKIIENWWIWIFADVLYALLFFYKDLYITAVLYFTLAILAVYGFIKWKKQIRIV